MGARRARLRPDRAAVLLARLRQEGEENDDPQTLGGPCHRRCARAVGLRDHGCRRARCAGGRRTAPSDQLRPGGRLARRRKRHGQRLPRRSLRGIDRGTALPARGGPAAVVAAAGGNPVRQRMPADTFARCARIRLVGERGRHQRGLPVPQRVDARPRRREEAPDHGLAARRRLRHRFRLEQWLRRVEACRAGRCGRGHAQPPAERAGLFLPQRADRRSEICR